MWFHLRPVSSIFNSLIKQGECKFKNISKDKVKSLCQAFADLNKCIAVLLQEIIITGKLNERDISLRKNAVATVTANLMTIIFEDEDAHEIALMMENMKDDTINELKKLFDVMSNPN